MHIKELYRIVKCTASFSTTKLTSLSLWDRVPGRRIREKRKFKLPICRGTGVTAVRFNSSAMQFRKYTVYSES